MSVSMREMLEAGCHFGHQTRFWNPKMAQYIFGARNKIHIINLEKTVEKLAEAEKFVRELSARGGKILFVDTKRGGRDTIIEQAQRAGCCYVDQRWLGEADDPSPQGHGSHARSRRPREDEQEGSSRLHP